MIVNGRMAWNMSAIDVYCNHQHFIMTNWKFQMILANQLIQFHDETSVDLVAEARLNRSVDRIMTTSDHIPVAIAADSRVKCCICKIEDGFHVLLTRKTPDGVTQLENAMGKSCSAIQTGVYNQK